MRPVPQNFLCKLAVKAALGMTLFLSLALAHDLNLPRPTPEQMAQVQPMRPGATEFATELLAHYRNQFNPQQLVVLDRVAGSLTAVEQLRSGAAHHLTAPETVLYQSFYQWQADAALLELMDLQTNALAFDLRQAPCKPSLATELDQQFNQLLLKVFTGDGAPAFRVQEMSLVSERAPEMWSSRPLRHLRRKWSRSADPPTAHPEPATTKSGPHTLAEWPDCRLSRGCC